MLQKPLVGLGGLGWENNNLQLHLPHRRALAHDMAFGVHDAKPSCIIIIIILASFCYPLCDICVSTVFRIFPYYMCFRMAFGVAEGCATTGLLYTSPGENRNKNMETTQPVL